ncbi:MAG TPA: ABC transporter substrate-binding protein [Acetobacteraceae bacterium]|nr:ABC transporter substrate-binding protein [Acetobacteraceae bacterium]
MNRLAFAALLALTVAARAEVPNNLVKVGVLTDMSGPFADQVGAGSVAAAKMAAEDFMAEGGALKVEILSADHQNKPDVGTAQARRWVDQDGVAAIVDLPNSAVALSVANVLKEKNRTTLASSSATSDLTGKACAPTTVQWVLDTWSLGHSTAVALLQQGAKSWFFLTVDYALGQALERDAAEAVVAGGGKVLGQVRHPLGAPDLSSALLQAQSSGAQVLALANTGADVINSIKQAGEFGLTQSMKVAALFIQLSDVHGLGLQAAQGLLTTEAFYWDLNDGTRAFAKRFASRMGGRMPTANHAGVYAATMAYLHAVKAANTIEGDKVVAQMKAQPSDDPTYGRVEIRADGRAIHPMYLFRVKAPSASKGPYDYYELVQTVPADKAFRPLNEGGCPLVK